MRLRGGTMLLGAAFCLTTAGLAFGADDIDRLKDKLLKEQCNLCHSSKRIMNMDPAQITAVVERMRKMNPDWFVDIKNEHMIEALAAILKDPAMIATREAWKNAVERGGQLFVDTGLGKNEYNCRACHNPPEVLRNVADSFPRWDPKLKRFVDINEAINLMIVDKLGGEQLPPNDPRLFDIIAYLKSLK